MSTPQSIRDDIWQVLNETKTILKELAISQKETDRKFQETDRKFQETDRKFQETDRQFKETDRKFQETDRQFKETDRKLGKLGNRLGDFVEDAVKPAAVRLFKECGINIHIVMQNVSAKLNNEGLEIDLLVSNDTDIIAIECKSNLKISDITEHQERLHKIKRLMPKYANYRIMGAVAAMIIDDEVAKYASRQGLYVIGQSGDHMMLRNSADFKPKEW